MLPHLLLSALITILITAHAAAQPKWEYLGGPSGAHITSLARDADGNLYAAAVAGMSYDRSPQGKGLYRSTDNGESWKHVAFRGQSVVQVGAAPDRTLFALIGSKTGQDGDSVATSRDGIDWSVRTLGRVNIRRIVTQGNAVHMVMRDLGVLSSTGGTYSYPRHNPWQETAGTTTIALSPSGTLLNGCESCRTIIMYDSGRSWTEGTLVGARWLAHDGEGTFYAHCRDSFRFSTDDGQTWRSLPPAPMDIMKFIADPRFGLLGIGADRVILYSPDHGRTWTRMEVKESIDAEITDAIFTRNGEIIVGTKTRGLFRRTASGQWAPIGDDIRNAASTSITIAPDGSLLVGSEGGIYRSTDEGSTWSGREARLPFWIEPDIGIGRRVGSFHHRPDGSITAPFGNLIFRSSDNGASWHQHTHVGRGEVHALAYASDDHFYVVPRNGEIMEFAREKLIGWGNFRVNVGGSNYETGFSALHLHEDRIYAISQWRIYLSRDRGATWKALPVVPENTNAGVSAILDDGSILITNYCGRLYRLPEDGIAWEKIGALPDRIERIIPIQGETILALAGGRVLRSINGGRLWIEVGTGLENEWVTGVTLGPDGRLYAATASGIFTCKARSAFSRTAADKTGIRPQLEVDADSVTVSFRLPFTSAVGISIHRNGNTASNGWSYVTGRATAGNPDRMIVGLGSYPAGEYMAYFTVGCSMIDSVAFTVTKQRR